MLGIDSAGARKRTGLNSGAGEESETSDRGLAVT